MASKANRDGVAERVPEPAVPKRIDVDLALIGHSDHRRRDMALSVLNTAKPHEATTRYLRRPVPGSGEMLRLVLLYASHHSARFPRVQDCASYCRPVKGAKASAGKRDGTAGTKIGQAYLTGAFADAAVRFLRANPAGPKYLGRLENKHGQGKALTGLAHQLARAV
jgi:hypothetical protein